MDISGVGAAGGMHAVSGASSSGPPQQKMSSLFDSIDTSGSGSITQSQFDQAFQTKNPPAVFQNQGADAIFASLDPNGTGSVSKQDFVSGMSQMMASLRADNAGSSGSTPAASLAASVQSLNLIDPASLPQATLPGSLIDLKA
jgi:EF-hand domain pair